MSSTPASRVSMREIAKAVGVSVSAVSLAIKNSPRVSEPVRQKIHAKIREMGYRPDPMLRALNYYRRGKTTSGIKAEIAWLNCQPTPKELRSFREFQLYWEGACDEARLSGFRLEEFTLKECESWTRLEGVLRARNIFGLLVPPHGAHWPDDWQKFHWEDFCIVKFGHSMPQLRTHLVTSDQLTDGLIAFENIWNKGYRRITYVTTQDTTVRGTRFSAGFLMGQIKMRAKARLYPLLFNDRWNPKEKQKRLAAWLKQTRPDAIFTDRPDLERLLANCGYQVPKDLGLATTSVLDGAVSAGINQNSREIGKAAVQLLISLINHNQCGIPDICRELLIEGCWVDGDTLPNATQKK